MAIEIEEIKHIRKKLGLTQNELAQRAQVSQSLIAKVESGRLDPTYSNAQKIFNALNELSKKNELKAEELMTDRIISVSPEDPIKDAIVKMKKFNISQMPVIEEQKSIGFVSESIILEALLKSQAKRVKEIMQDSPPIISKNTTLSVVSTLLKFHPLILVSEDGRLKGIITKSDLLAKVYK